MLKEKYLCIIKIPLLLFQAKSLLQKKKRHSKNFKKLYVPKCKIEKKKVSYVYLSTVSYPDDFIPTKPPIEQNFKKCKRWNYKIDLCFLFPPKFCGENVYICWLNPTKSDSLYTKIKLLKQKDRTLKLIQGQKKNNRYTINFSKIIRKELLLYAFLITS